MALQIDTENSFQFKRIPDTYECVYHVWPSKDNLNKLDIYTGYGMKVPFHFESGELVLTTNNIVCTDSLVVTSLTDSNKFINIETYNANINKFNSYKLQYYNKPIVTLNELINDEKYNKHVITHEQVIDYYKQQAYLAKQEYNQNVGTTVDFPNIQNASSGTYCGRLSFSFTLSPEDVKTHYTTIIIPIEIFGNGNYGNKQYYMYINGRYVQTKIHGTNDGGHGGLSVRAPLTFIYTAEPAELQTMNTVEVKTDWYGFPETTSWQQNTVVIHGEGY